MYTYHGYLNNIDMEISDMDHPLLISGCGIYRLIHQPVMDTVRPEGRTDYQLLYISSGRAFFELTDDGAPLSAHSSESIANCPSSSPVRKNTASMAEITAGNMVLYRPGDVQHYRYLVEDHPEVCWIHFTGFEAESLLNGCGFRDRHILPCGISSDYPELFRQIIRELQLKRPCYEEFIPLYLRRIFAEIHRNQRETTLEPCPNRAEMVRAVHDFNESFADEISIKDYAAAHHMSVCWFIRSFRLYMGMTPMQYITSLRITRAKDLLRSTDYSVQEIGAMAGYENPLYFSRIFKKYTGYSPSEYRA